MITDNLFDEVLLTPAIEGCDKLCILSGYATSAMTFHHIKNLIEEYDLDIEINLILGMTSYDGISIGNHKGFIQLVENEFNGRLTCNYNFKNPPVHSKIYTWIKDDIPCLGYLGSANYSQRAFFGKSREVMIKCNPRDTINYFNSIEPNTISCTHNEIEDSILIYRESNTNRSKITDFDDLDFGSIDGLESVTVSFINRYGKISERSGLNWGQRPDEGREPNQAYIPLKSDIYKASFFPEVGRHFTVTTDDGKVLICSRAQENGKAIHTPHNNSLIGEYFRNRLNVPNGALVTMEDFKRYGRYDVEFQKIDEENYYMNFSAN